MQQMRDGKHNKNNHNHNLQKIKHENI
jgi:hypothetical protein